MLVEFFVLLYVDGYTHVVKRQHALLKLDEVKQSRRDRTAISGQEDTIQRGYISSIALPFIVEVTFHEVRTHLGVETQRQWADLLTLRITPALLSLFSNAPAPFQGRDLDRQLACPKTRAPIQQTAWYAKTLPIFSDAMSLVKDTLYAHRYFQTSQFKNEVRKVPRARSIYRFLALLVPLSKFHLDKV